MIGLEMRDGLRVFVWMHQWDVSNPENQSTKQWQDGEIIRREDPFPEGSPRQRQAAVIVKMRRGPSAAAARCRFYFLPCICLYPLFILVLGSSASCFGPRIHAAGWSGAVSVLA